MPKSPSYRQNRVEWNKAWEKELDIIYGTSQEIRLRPGVKPSSLLDWKNLPSITDRDVQVWHQLKGQLCTLQRDLSKKVSLRFAENDFEEVWKKCTAKEREKWMLEGLCRTCDATFDFEDMRRLAPETKLARLNFQSGQGFLDLIGKLVLQDIETIPEEFRTVPNVVYDTLNGRTMEANNRHHDQAYQYFQRANDCRRMLFLTLFTWKTLLAFYGESEECVVMKVHDSKDPYSDVKKRARETGEKNFIKQIRQAKPACTSCGRTAERAEVSNLQACQRCKSIDRYVYYCSKECQVKDWKTGHPPHKTICGDKAAYINSMLEPNQAASVPGGSQESGQSSDTSNAGLDDEWGNVEPGFTRLPALLHQLKVLKENPHADYIFVRPYPLEDAGFVVQSATAKALFKMCLKRAVCSPAPSAVLVMYTILEKAASSVDNYGKLALKKQLQREYGFDIDALDAMAKTK